MILGQRMYLRLVIIVITFLMVLFIGLQGPFLMSTSAKAGKSVFSGIFQQKDEPEVRHIGFLKVHKCASTTVMNMLYRFGLKRDLNFVIPMKGNYINPRRRGRPITEVPAPLGSDYDILCNHVPKFDSFTFSSLLPADSVYIAIVREPFDRMKSAFHYYRNYMKNAALLKINTSDPFASYMKRPKYFESQWGVDSLTNNKMAFDFGFPVHTFRNRSRIKDWIQYVDETFDLVMVSEHFDESLVLMRRLLRWPFKDILYLKLNSYPLNTSSSETVTKRLKPYLKLDYMFYEHFLQKLKRTIEKEGLGFLEEVEYFKTIIEKNTQFCSANSSHSELEFPANQFHEYFSVSVEECKFISMSEANFLKLIRDKQINNVLTKGANVSRLLT